MTSALAAGASMLRSMRVIVSPSHQMSATYRESPVTISPFLINSPITLAFTEDQPGNKGLFSFLSQRKAVPIFIRWES